MSLEEIREKARKFEKSIRARNFIEYAAAAIVLVNFGLQIFRPEPLNVMTRIGSGLIVLATIYVVYMLHTRGSAKNIPEAMARASFIDFYRSSLENQRDLLLRIWRWYLLPFVPGMAAMFVSFAIRDGLLFNPNPSPEQLRDGLFLLIFVGVIIAFFFVVAAINKRSARKLQAQIDALDRR